MLRDGPKLVWDVLHCCYAATMACTMTAFEELRVIASCGEPVANTSVSERV